jgi:hypothetical protein
MILRPSCFAWEYLELKIQPKKIRSCRFPIPSPLRIIRHPSPPHQFAISSVPIRSWPSDRSLVDMQQSGWRIKGRHINQLYKTKQAKRSERHAEFFVFLKK